MIYMLESCDGESMLGLTNSLYDIGEIEKIGTIYENPELLENTQND